MVLKDQQKRKGQKLRIQGRLATKKHLNQVIFGSIGLKALESGRLTAAQIEVFRRGTARFLKRKAGQFWVRQVPLYPITKKPTETRMGKGKGALYKHVVRVTAGMILFELEGFNDAVILLVFQYLQKKLGLQCQIVYRRYF